VEGVLFCTDFSHCKGKHYVCTTETTVESTMEALQKALQKALHKTLWKALHVHLLLHLPRHPLSHLVGALLQCCGQGACHIRHSQYS
jgi:hypothetical protein